MRAQKVESAAQISEFLSFPAKLYKDDPHYIQPLNNDVEAVFDSKKNKFFRFGECERFLFLNDNNETVGRVAVFVNRKYRNEQPTGGFGFFDCINDQQTADFIFDFCRNWHQQRGMEAMDGPINFGERDKFSHSVFLFFTQNYKKIKVH